MATGFFLYFNSDGLRIHLTNGNVILIRKTLYYKNPGTGVRDWPYDAPFYVILNLAWGGDWGGSQGVDETKLPVTMKVDYVRVFQKL